MEEVIDFVQRTPLLSKGITSILWLVIVNVVANLLKRSVSRLLQNSDSLYTIRKALTYLGYVISFVIILAIFSDQLGNLAVALGVAGAGIAFALQEVIVSLAGWLALTVGGLFHVGDRIQLGGSKGDVIDIGILRTTLMEIGEWVDGDLYNGRIVRIANSFVFKEPVYNYSMDFPFVWDEIKVPIKYGGDFLRAREILERVAEEVVGEYVPYAQETWEKLYRKYAIEQASVRPMITMKANDNWVEFTVRYVVDYKKRRGTMDELFLRILKEFEATGGRVEIASATFQLVQMPDLKVDLRRVESEMK